MAQTKIRMPVAAGQFYPGEAKNLRKQIESFVHKEAPKSGAFACVLPHAGYIYSGRVAVETVSLLEVKDRVILLGPNHTGYGQPFSIAAEGIWQTPLGEVEIDEALTGELLAHSRYLKADNSAHAYEHSLEIELPILQYFKSGFKIIPITILSDDIKTLKELGKEIAAVITALNLKDSCLLIASSDMTHYEPHPEAEKKDREAINAILDLDADRLMEKIVQFNISMCGYAPVVALISCVKAMGARAGKLVRYQTSGEITGDKSSVVGYAGITIS